MCNKLKALRIEKKLTQQQVAERIGVAVSAMSAYESGDRLPNYKALIKLATLYHVSCDYLVGLDKNRSIDVSGLSEEEIGLISQAVDLFRNKNNHL